jgi:hypothetical protein
MVRELLKVFKKRLMAITLIITLTLSKGIKGMELEVEKRSG